MIKPKNQLRYPNAQFTSNRLIITNLPPDVVVEINAAAPLAPYRANFILNIKGSFVSRFRPVYPDFLPIGGEDPNLTGTFRINPATNKLEIISEPALDAYVFINLNVLELGDYIWTDQFRSADPHGFMVVGWGKIMDCDSARTTNFSLSLMPDGINDQLELFPTKPAIEINVNGQPQPFYTVPYVVDFSGGYSERLQRPVPRPFYCSADADTAENTILGGFYTKGHGWYAFKMPDSVTIDDSWLYVSPAWLWSGN